MSNVSLVNGHIDYDELTHQEAFLSKKDVVLVVRCKDCKYFITDVFKRTMCNRTFTMFEMNENDYCSYGERK